jgi:hypothetical protein
MAIAPAFPVADFLADGLDGPGDAGMPRDADPQYGAGQPADQCFRILRESMAQRGVEERHLDGIRGRSEQGLPSRRSGA